MRFLYFVSAFFFLSSPVLSGPIAGSSFGDETWSGMAFYNDETGKWSHCAVSAEYPNGFELSFSLAADYSLGLFVRHTSEQVFLNSGEFEVVTKVDNYASIFGSVTPISGYMAGPWYNDLDTAIAQFKKGRLLTISSRLGTEKFGLRGTYKALGAAYACAARYENYATRIDETTQNAEEALVAWKPSAVDTSAMYQLATLLISDFNLKDFRYSQPDDKVVPGSVQFWANGDTLLGIVAVGRNAGGEVDLNQAMAEDLASLTTEYCGDGDMAIVNSTIKIEGIVTKSLEGLCDRPNDPFTTYVTKQVISGRLVETIILNFNDATVAGTHSEVPTENAGIIAAKFIE